MYELKSQKKTKNGAKNEKSTKWRLHCWMLKIKNWNKHRQRHNVKPHKKCHHFSVISFLLFSVIRFGLNPTFHSTWRAKIFFLLTKQFFILFTFLQKKTKKKRRNYLYGLWCIYIIIYVAWVHFFSKTFEWFFV